MFVVRGPGQLLNFQSGYGDGRFCEGPDRSSEAYGSLGGSTDPGADEVWMIGGTAVGGVP